MKTNRIIILTVLALMGMSSCSNKLDIPRKGVLDKESYYEMDENITAAVSSMYLQLRSGEFNSLFCRNMLTDDLYCGGAEYNDNPDLQSLNDFSFNTEESYIENMFTNYYSIIYKANVILDNVKPESGEVARQAIAEAHVFRAFAYFDLITLWGNPPIVDHELSPSEYKQGNASTEDLWALVEKDLTTAISSGALAVKTSLNDNTTWRVTEHFARALLGKSYLWMAWELNDNSYYAKSAETLDVVVDSHLYELFTAAPFGDMFFPEYNLNCESLFESIRVNDSDHLDVNLAPIMYGWRSYGNEMTIPAGVSMTGGFGFCVPTQDLYDSFTEAGDTYRRQESFKTYDELVAMGVTVNQPVVSAGYWMWKNRTRETDKYWGGWATVYNAHWMRYAEVLLLAAEAHYMNGDPQGKALIYVNQVRNRAQLAPLGSIASLDVIKREKRHEFVGESLRFQDLLRWGDAAEKLKDNGKYYPECPPNGIVRMVETKNANAGFKTGKHEHLPYPYTETQLNENVKQHEGY